MIKRILAVLFVAATLSSCNAFLEVTPKNVISMRDMANIKRVMGGYLWNVNDGRGGVNNSVIPYSAISGEAQTYLNCLSDEWDLSRSWNKDLTEAEMKNINWENTVTSGLWNYFYNIIGFMNNLIHEADLQSERGEMYDYVTGEAYVNRAYCFFKLVQYFAPYNDNRLGVPICLETYSDYDQLDLSRRTQTEVYKQIISDLNAAMERLDRTNPRPNYSILYNQTIVNRLFAEIYLFKAGSGAKESTDWANAAKYAGMENKNATLTNDPVKLTEYFNCQIPESVLNGVESPIRIAASFGGGGSMYSYLYGNYKMPNPACYEIYGDDDIRKKLYWVEDIEVSVPNDDEKETLTMISKYGDPQSGSSLLDRFVYLGFRQSEMFLIEAEALAYSNPAAAADVLRRFKESRYTSAITVPASKDEILKEVYKERQKEFLAENDMRWLDMKRLGIGAIRDVRGIIYTLEPHDYRFAFRIPNNEIDGNIYITENNPGWGDE